MRRYAAIYTRISRDDDGKQTSTARQERLCRAWVAQQGWDVAGVYTDIGRSAYAARPVVRDAYEHLIANITDKKIDVVVCWRLDRLARSPGDFERFWASCRAAGVDIASVTEPVDSTTSTGLALARMLVTFAQLESDAKSARVRAKQRESAERGEPHGRPPFGLSKDRSRIVEEEAGLIREAARRVLDGEGCPAIARELAARGVMKRDGKPFSANGLRSLLRSRAICGDSTYKGEVVASGCWPAIIDPLMAAQVRIRLHGTSSSLGGRGTDHLLRGLLRCSRCGEKLVLRTSHGRAEFICGICRLLVIARAPTEDWITEQVLARIEARHSRSHRVRWSRGRAAAAVAALDTRADALRALNAAYLVRGEITHTEWRRARDELLLECHVELARAVPVPQPRGFPPNVRLWEARRLWSELSVAARREVLAAEMAWVIVHPAKEHTSYWRAERLEFVWVRDDPSDDVSLRMATHQAASATRRNSDPKGPNRLPDAGLTEIELRERGLPVTIREACRLTGRAESTINNARRGGYLCGELIDERWRFHIAELDRWQAAAAHKAGVRHTPEPLLTEAEVRCLLGIDDAELTEHLAAGRIVPSRVDNNGRLFSLQQVRRCASADETGMDYSAEGSLAPA